MTLDLQEIRQIVELMNEHGLTCFHIEKQDFNLKLKKGPDIDSLRALLGSLPAPAAAPAAAPAPAGPPAAPVAEGVEITSPMVGTFYNRPKPDADPFVSTGDTVTTGQTLCIIEAMKVMNEIEAETAGIIREILVENASPVEAEAILFLIEPQ